MIKNIWSKFCFVGSTSVHKNSVIARPEKRLISRNILLSTKSFRFFPLYDFNRSKSFFSIANFWPYMVFDSWRFIDYSVKKSFKLWCLFIVFPWFEMEIPDGLFRHIYFITSGKVKTQCKLGKSCMIFMVKNH